MQTEPEKKYFPYKAGPNSPLTLDEQVLFDLLEYAYGLINDAKLEKALMRKGVIAIEGITQESCHEALYCRSQDIMVLMGICMEAASVEGGELEILAGTNLSRHLIKDISESYEEVQKLFEKGNKSALERKLHNIIDQVKPDKGRPFTTFVQNEAAHAYITRIFPKIYEFAKTFKRLETADFLNEWLSGEFKYKMPAFSAELTPQEFKDIYFLTIKNSMHVYVHAVLNRQFSTIQEEMRNSPVTEHDLDGIMCAAGGSIKHLRQDSEAFIEFIRGELEESGSLSYYKGMLIDIMEMVNDNLDVFQKTEIIDAFSNALGRLKAVDQVTQASIVHDAHYCLMLLRDTLDDVSRFPISREKLKAAITARKFDGKEMSAYKREVLAACQRGLDRVPEIHLEDTTLNRAVDSLVDKMIAREGRIVEERIAEEVAAKDLALAKSQERVARKEEAARVARRKASEEKRALNARLRAETKAFMAVKQPYVIGGNNSVYNQVYALKSSRNISASATAFCDTVVTALGKLDLRDEKVAVRELGDMLTAPRNLVKLASVYGIDKIDARQDPSRAAQLQLNYQTSAAYKMAIERLLADRKGALLVAVMLLTTKECSDYVEAWDEKKLVQARAARQNIFAEFSEEEFLRELATPQDLRNLAAADKLIAELQEKELAVIQKLADAVRARLEGRGRKKISLVFDGSSPVTEDVFTVPQVIKLSFEKYGNKFYVEKNPETGKEKYVRIYSTNFPELFIDVKANIDRETLIPKLGELDQAIAPHQNNKDILADLSAAGFVFMEGKNGRVHREYAIQVEFKGGLAEQNIDLYNALENFKGSQFVQEQTLVAAISAGLAISDADGKSIIVKNDALLPVGRWPITVQGHNGSGRHQLAQSGYLDYDELALVKDLIRQTLPPPPEKTEQEKALIAAVNAGLIIIDAGGVTIESDELGLIDKWPITVQGPNGLGSHQLGENGSLEDRDLELVSSLVQRAQQEEPDQAIGTDKPQVYEHDPKRAMLLFDSSTCQNLATERGEPGVDPSRTLLDLVKCTARLPTTKPIFTSVIVWELTGDIPTHDSEGRFTGWKTIDPTRPNAELFRHLLRDASFGRMVDGQILLDTRGSSNMLITKTAEDQALFDKIESLYGAAKKDPNDTRDPLAGHGIYKCDKGEESMLDLIDQLQNYPGQLKIITDDMRFSSGNKRFGSGVCAPESREVINGQGAKSLSRVTTDTTLVYLKAECRNRQGQKLHKHDGEAERLGEFHQVMDRMNERRADRGENHCLVYEESFPGSMDQLITEGFKRETAKRNGGGAPPPDSGSGLPREASFQANYALNKTASWLSRA